MTDTQFCILALIGTVACALLALLLKREMPPSKAKESTPIKTLPVLPLMTKWCDECHNDAEEYYYLFGQSCPRCFPETSAPTPAPIAHSHHIYALHRNEDGSVTETELRNGMLDPENHAEVGRCLSSGPNDGIRWNDGKEEWGR